VIFYPTNVAIISDGNSIYKMTLPENGINVTIFYIHSVERSPIYEVLKINATGIYAIEMRWKDFGAGLPEDFQYIDSEGFYVKKIDIYLGKTLQYWFIPENNAEIIVNNHVVFAPKKDTLIKFQVENTVLIKTL